MTTHTKQKQINITEKTHSYFQLIKEKTGIPMAVLLNRIGYELTSIMINFDTNASLEFDSNAISGLFTIQVRGKHNGNLSFGTAKSEADLMSIIDKQIRKVKP